MKNITNIIFISFLFALCSCDQDPEADKKMIKDHFNQVTEFYYLKDPRTNLCFISNSLNFTNALLSNVPCTPEVISLLVNDK